MRTPSLYRCLVLSVLLLWGCGAEDPAEEPGVRAKATAQDTSFAGSYRDADGQETNEKVVLILGNSITAGYGLDPEQAFPALLQDRIDSLGWNVEVVNAGLSGETSAGGLRRVEWVMRRPADVLIIELGGNDGLRGLPPEATKENLEGIIEKAREINPDIEIILAGMQIPPNLGADYAEAFRSIYPELADEEDVRLIPFILEGVGGEPELNLPDGIHPTARGHRIVAANVWETLEPVLESLLQERIQATH